MRGAFPLRPHGVVLRHTDNFTLSYQVTQKWGTGVLPKCTLGSHSFTTKRGREGEHSPKLIRILLVSAFTGSESGRSLNLNSHLTMRGLLSPRPLSANSFVVLRL